MPAPALLDRALVTVARQVTPLSALTPINASAERARLLERARTGQICAPAWEYRPPPGGHELTAAVEELDRQLAAAPTSELVEAYRQRRDELVLEAAIQASAGSTGLAALAHRRYALGPAAMAEASHLATAWRTAADDADDADEDDLEPLASDADDPRSLLAQLRAEIGRTRLPFRVLVAPELAALAATGDGVIYVAAGRRIHEEDARRTVLHEVHGHAVPRARARRASSCLPRVGTARGVDDQEGYALVLEERHGFLAARRRGELAVRFVAVQAMRDGATFHEVVQLLLPETGAERAVLVAERAFRGSDGTFPGLGRESVYLTSYLRVRRFLAAAENPAPAENAREHLLASGQISVEAAGALGTLLATAV